MDNAPSRRRILAASVGTLASTLLTACAGTPTPVPATGTQRAAAAGGTLGLGIIGLVVRDLGASLRFYQQLGLDIPPDVDTSAGAFRLPQPNGTILFWESLDYVRQYFPDYGEPAVGDRKVVLEFGFATAEDVDAMYEALVAAGHGGHLPPLDLGKSIRYAIVVDPDDNQISLRWPLTS